MHTAATSASDPAIPDAGRQTDAGLVARAARGDASAFVAIMRLHNRLVFRCVRGVISDEADAQDAVQETYLRAFSTLHTFRGDCALGTWLARLAINIAHDAQRRRRRRVPVDQLPDFDAEPAPEHRMAFASPTTASPDAQAERREVRELVQGAIDSLPPIYRSVFILRAVQEMSVDETASCLQVSEVVVKTRYLRARSMLRDALSAQVETRAQDAYAFAGARCDAVVAHVLAALHSQGRIRPEGSG